MGLGMLVDDGIVVVDNVFANLQKGMGRIEASKIGIGEIAWPVISSTATTLAAFFPLGLWPGTMGKFMIYFPATLSVVLFASLFVAMIINASMTGGFMTLKDDNVSRSNVNKYTKILVFLGLVLSIPGWMLDNSLLKSFGHFSFIMVGFVWLYHKYIFNATQKFQLDIFPRFENWYGKFLLEILNDSKAKKSLIVIIGLLFFSVILMSLFPRKVLFFPDNVPNMNIVYIEYPQGTPIEKTNEATKKVELEVLEILKKYRQKDTSKGFLVQSVLSQVGEGAGNPRADAGNTSETPFKGKVTVLYTEFNKRSSMQSFFFFF
jgi:multidrug efflux pump subunit AcrB